MDELVNPTFVIRVAKSTDPFISTEAASLISKFTGRCLKEVLKHASTISMKKTLTDVAIRNATFDLCAVYPVPMSNPGSRKRTRTGKPAIEGQTSVAAAIDAAADDGQEHDAAAMDDAADDGQEPAAAAMDEAVVDDPPTVDVLAMEY